MGEQLHRAPELSLLFLISALSIRPHGGRVQPVYVLLDPAQGPAHSGPHRRLPLPRHARGTLGRSRIWLGRIPYCTHCSRTHH